MSELKVRGSLAGKHVLVTGVTGFLGKVLVAFLLEHELVARITVLARGKRFKDARARIAEALTRSPAFRSLRAAHASHPGGLGGWLEGRLDVVEGDAKEPHLGLSPAVRASLESRIDVVVNVAGLTDFSPDPVDGLAVNVHGALAAAELAQACRGRRLLHVSTCFVAGGVDGAVPEAVSLGDDGDARSPNGTRFDPEDELRAIESLCRGVSGKHADVSDARRARIDAGTLRARSLGWPNLYTYGKALAELLIVSRQRRERSALRVSMLRPSIVECARSFPFAGWNEGVNTAAPLVWLTGTMHRRMPFSAGHVFDVVPIDEVVKGTTLALAGLCREDAPALEVLQVATGDHNPFDYRRVLDLTALARRRQYARSHDAFERVVLQHLDSVIWDVAAEDDPVLPALKSGVRTARDLLVGFDVEHWLPRGPRARRGSSASSPGETSIADRIQSMAGRAAKQLGQASRTIGQVAEMLRAYQPFVFDHDPRFETKRMRALSASIGAGERAAFAVDTGSIDWRDYWMNVEIPGLDRWSLPLLRGERVPDDEPISLGRALDVFAAGEEQSEGDVAYAGDAE